MEFSFKVVKKDKRTRARTAVINTAHGAIKTPAFSPVATRATVKALDPQDLKDAGSQVVLGNTYHLYLRPGLEVIEGFGGFASFMKWGGPTITDSGGYQISFLWSPKEKEDEDRGRVVKITDKGATFSSHIDGSKHLLTPERSMEIQHALGADIIMALDQPLGFLQSVKEKKEAFERTLSWEERSFVAWKKLEEKRKKGAYQALFGIVQGEEAKKLRQQSLKFVLKMGFPGIAIGGQTIGKDPRVTASALDTVAELLPDDKPLHTLGLGGGPEGIFGAVERGMDMFDNTSITRQARTGLLFVYPEDGGSVRNKFRIDITKARFKSLKKPVSKVCQCYACRNFSAAYLHHLLVSNELLGFRLASIHNVLFINDLMERIRRAIESGNFVPLKKEWLEA